METTQIEAVKALFVKSVPTDAQMSALKELWKNDGFVIAELVNELDEDDCKSLSDLLAAKEDDIVADYLSALKSTSPELTKNFELMTGVKAAEPELETKPDKASTPDNAPGNPDGVAEELPDGDDLEAAAAREAAKNLSTGKVGVISVTEPPGTTHPKPSRQGNNESDEAYRARLAREQAAAQAQAAADALKLKEAEIARINAQAAADHAEHERHEEERKRKELANKRKLALDHTRPVLTADEQAQADARLAELEAEEEDERRVAAGRDERPSAPQGMGLFDKTMLAIAVMLVIMCAGLGYGVNKTLELSPEVKAMQVLELEARADAVCKERGLTAGQCTKYKEAVVPVAKEEQSSGGWGWMIGLGFLATGVYAWSQREAIRARLISALTPTPASPPPSP